MSDNMDAWDAAKRAGAQPKCGNCHRAKDLHDGPELFCPPNSPRVGRFVAAVPPSSVAPAGAQEPRREHWREQYERDVLRTAESNHIWLNAFSCMRPSDEFAMRVGREVLRMLDDDRCTIASRTAHVLNLPFAREVVIRVNKS